MEVNEKIAVEVINELSDMGRVFPKLDVHLDNVHMGKDEYGYYVVVGGKIFDGDKDLDYFSHYIIDDEFSNAVRHEYVLRNRKEVNEYMYEIVKRIVGGKDMSVIEGYLFDISEMIVLDEDDNAVVYKYDCSEDEEIGIRVTVEDIESCREKIMEAVETLRNRVIDMEFNGERDKECEELMNEIMRKY